MLEAHTGACVWLTGRSGGGKSTIARALVPRLEARGTTVSVLDVIPLLRKRWWERSSEGKLLRKAYVASHVVRHGGIVIAVTVSARQSVRDEARRMIGPDRFVEVLVAPPPEIAAARKAARPRKPRLVKRLRRMLRRALARAVLRRAAEGPAREPDLVIDSAMLSPGEAAEEIVALMDRRGLLPVVEPSVPRRPQ